MKKRLEEIDILRGMAILMVILYHSILVYPINLHEITWCSDLHELLWLIEMPLFFLVSGFCFSYKERYTTYLWKKVKRILVPHIVFASVDLIPRMIPNNLVNEKMNWKDGIKELLLYGGTDWFLWTLFLIMLVFPLLYKFMQLGLVPKVLVLLFAICCFFMQKEITGLFQLATLAKFFLYFVIGHLLQTFPYEKVKQWGGNSILALIFTGMTGIVFFAGRHYGYLQNGNDLLIGVVEVVIALSGAWVCYYLALRCKGLPGKLFLVSSKYSLQMYLLNGYALVVTRTILVSVMGVTLPWFIVVSNFILDTCIVLIVSKFILDRWKIFRFMSGLS